MNFEQQINTPEINVNNPERQSLPDVDLSFLQTNAPEFQVLNRVEKETKEVQAENRAILTDISATKVPRTAKVALPVDQTVTQTSSGFTTPAIAKDADRIEYEWVDVVKQVVASTADDPRQREECIKDVQEDYLFKRYGRRAGDSNGKTEISI